MQVRPAPGQLAGGIHTDPVCRADYPDQGPLWQDFPAAHTGALRHMLDALDRFLAHILSFYSSQSHSPAPRLCFFFVSIKSRSGS